MAGDASLYVRLRNAVGLGAVALGSLGSGPCGSCFDKETTSCVSLEAYQRWAAMQGGGGAAGAAPGGAAGATEDPGACPSPEAFARFEDARLGYPSSYDWLEQVPAADAGSAAPDSGTPCCYRGKSKQPHCPGGRPFLVGGTAELAGLDELDASSTATRTTFLDGTLARALGAAWLHAARVEHASVAAFARLSLELLAHGAPLDLVADAQRAALDELRHAELCLAQAHRYTARRFAFGRLQVDGCLQAASNLAAFVTTNILEGCIGETVAAAVVREQARRAADRELAAALHRVAEDETAHAVLAWRILRWALATGGDAIRVTARRVFAEALPRRDDAGPAPSSLDGLLPEHGQLGAAEQHAIALGVWSDAIAPLARELLTAPSVAVTTPVAAAV